MSAASPDSRSAAWSQHRERSRPSRPRASFRSTSSAGTFAATGGEIPDEDRQENELSLREGYRVLSSYRTRLGTRLWVITEADRSSTCLLLPEEY